MYIYMYTYDKVNNVFPHIIFLVFKLWEHKDICIYVCMYIYKQNSVKSQKTNLLKTLYSVKLHCKTKKQKMIICCGENSDTVLKRVINLFSSHLLILAKLGPYSSKMTSETTDLFSNLFSPACNQLKRLWKQPQGSAEIAELVLNELAVGLETK